ncbi:EAL domain-containing protein [Photobacterium carnosum]|uniref:EAL domain-containing protein n=1 Tax=Photobacterium carnosum TaxID=2023717 RepID=UPI0022AACBFA|nr:EAL domain-containing protein [Photobacterium carnosum]MCD9517155.1 EAL domain-containing protein [Photobacterium carnosum]
MLSFNFTVTMLLDEDFIKKIIDFIKKNPTIKNHIIIELTESENNFIYLNEINEIMQRLKKESVLLSIDDVGIGYSNLITIQELPFDIMKIDRCFISDNFALSKSNMLETLTRLGESLNMMIVAEGIETIAELNKINSLNIDLCQGFYYSTPCNANDFIKRTVYNPELYK